MASDQPFIKVDYINPFVESVYELFSTLLGCSVDRGDISIAQESGRPRDIIAMISLTGEIRGTVALSLPVTTALALVGRLTGNDTRVVDDTVLDGVAELVNVIAGGAKKRLSVDAQTPIDLGLPTVIRGKAYSIDHPKQSVWLDVPFVSDLGAFNLRVTLERKEN